MIWGALITVLLRKEMAVNDGWDGRSRDFRGGLLMSSSFRAGLRRSQLRLLVALSDVGAMVEDLGVSLHDVLLYDADLDLGASRGNYCGVIGIMSPIEVVLGRYRN